MRSTHIISECVRLLNAAKEFMQAATPFLIEVIGVMTVIVRLLKWLR